jgi:hypothetical protein
LAKVIYMVFCVHVDGDVVNGMAAYQPVVLVCMLCGGRMKTSVFSIKREQLLVEVTCYQTHVIKGYKRM